LYLTYLKDEEYSQHINIYTSFIIKLYIQDILHIDEQYHKPLIHIIELLQTDMHHMLKHWIQIDDNKEYLKIGYNNWIQYIEKKTLETIKKQIISEDIIRFKGFLKNISYYNKRFLMPQ